MSKDKIGIVIIGICVLIICIINLSFISYENRINRRLSELGYMRYDSSENKMIIKKDIVVVNGKDKEYLEYVIYYLKNGEMKNAK